MIKMILFMIGFLLSIPMMMRLNRYMDKREFVKRTEIANEFQDYIKKAGEQCD